MSNSQKECEYYPDVNALYKLIKDNGIIIDRECPPELVAIAMELKNGIKVIGLTDLSYAPVGVTLKEVVAHELGHVFTNSFYSLYDIDGERKRCDEKATEWAIKHIVPLSELLRAKERNIIGVKQLAQYFRVSRGFIRKAIAYYDKAEA